MGVVLSILLIKILELRNTTTSDIVVELTFNSSNQDSGVLGTRDAVVVLDKDFQFF